MAFGDSLRADGATVRLDADTGLFNQKIDQAVRNWQEGVGAMTTGALKLDLASDRVRKSIAKTGSESTQTKRATIALKDAQEAAARAADKQTRETEQLNRATRSAGAGFSSMRNRVLGLAAAYVGVHGLVSVIRSSIAAAKEEQLIRGQTGVALAALGISYDEHAAKINRVIRAISQLGFDDEALLMSFQKLVRGTKDVDLALERVALATGVARGSFKDLEFGTNVVTKAQLGMSGALRRLGLDVEKTASAVELITFLQQNFGKAAEEASDTAVAASDRLAVEWENMKEIVGGGLLPAVTDLSNRLSDYFGDAQNQAEVQRRVNEAVETGETAVRGLAGAFRFLNSTIVGPLRSLGLLDNLITTIFVVGLASKVAKGATAILSLVAAARAARIGVTREMALMSAAIDAATRPRVIPITTTGGGVPAPVGGGGRGGGLFGTAAILAGLIAAPALIEHILSQRGLRISGSDYDRLKKAARQGQITWAQLRELRGVLSDEQKREIAGLIAIAQASGGADSEDRRVRDRTRRGITAGGTAGGGRTLADIELDIARPGNEVGDLREKRGFIQRQIDALEARKNRTKAQKEKLAALYGELASTQAQLDAIAEEGERKLKEQRERARQKQRQREIAEGRVIERHNREAEQHEKRIASRGRGRGGMPLGERFERQKRMEERRREAARASGGGLTQADFRRELHDILTGLHGVASGFGSNISEGGGQTATNTFALVSLARDQNRTLDRLAGAMWHPGARYAGAELSVAGLGVGF